MYNIGTRESRVGASHSPSQKQKAFLLLSSSLRVATDHSPHRHSHSTHTHTLYLLALLVASKYLSQLYLVSCLSFHFQLLQVMNIPSTNGSAEHGAHVLSRRTFQMPSNTHSAGIALKCPIGEVKFGSNLSCQCPGRALTQKGRATLPDPSNGITKEEEP